MLNEYLKEKGSREEGKGKQVCRRTGRRSLDFPPVLEEVKQRWRRCTYHFPLVLFGS